MRERERKESVSKLEPRFSECTRTLKKSNSIQTMIAQKCTHTHRQNRRYRRRISNCKYSSELINRSIYHKERVICYTIIARNEPYTYIHTYINTIRNETVLRAASRKRNGEAGEIEFQKKTKTSRRRRPIPHHCRAAPILEELIVNLPTEKYSIQNLKQTKKKDNSKSPIVSQSGYRHRRNKPPPPPP